MATTVMDTVLNNKVLTATIIALLSAKSFAGEWQFQPKLLIDETYSNNVTLAPADEQSSLVSEVGIGFDSLFTSNKLDFSFISTSSYAMYSHDHELDNDFHTLAATFRLRLWPNGLALIAGASVSNEARNGANNALADIVSADTVRTESYGVGLEYNVNNSSFAINSNILYQLNESEDSIGEREGYKAQFTSTSGNAARNFYWDTSVDYADYTNNGRDGEIFRGEIKIGLITNYKITPFLRYFDENNEGDLFDRTSSLESDSYGAGLRWLITPKLSLDLSYNSPIGTQVDFDGKQQEDYVAAAVKWQPSQRTLLKMAYGQRFYGESYEFDFTHKNRRLTNKITYTEKVRAFTRNNYDSVELGSFWCPKGEITDASSCFVDSGDNINFDDYQLITLNDLVLTEDLDLSLNKELQWTSTLELSRTTFDLSLSGSERENLSTRVKDKNKSAFFSMGRKVSGESTVKFVFSYDNNHFALDQTGERQDRYRRYSLEYNKSLNSRLSVNISVSHLNRSSTTQPLNYEEERIYLKVIKGF